MTTMTRLATTLLTAAALFAPVAASAGDPPTYTRSVESGVRVFRGHVPQANLLPLLELQAREREAQAARAQAERFQNRQLDLLALQSQQLARIEGRLAGAGTTVIIGGGNGRNVFGGRSDFLYDALVLDAIVDDRAFVPGHSRPIGRPLAGRGQLPRFNAVNAGGRRFSRRGFAGRRLGAPGFGVVDGAGRPGPG